MLSIWKIEQRLHVSMAYCLRQTGASAIITTATESYADEREFDRNVPCCRLSSPEFISGYLRLEHRHRRHDICNGHEPEIRICPKTISHKCH